MNGDTITADRSSLTNTFTYAATPANGNQIATDNNENTTATNTVEALNTYFEQFNFFNEEYVPAFSVNDRVSIPFDGFVSYDDGEDGSLTLADYARVSISQFDNVDGDILTVSGIDLTFVDTATPAAGEIGSDGAGNWDADDIAAAINTEFGANNALAVNNEVFIYRTPTFTGVLSYDDLGDGGIAIIDAGSNRDQFAFTQGRHLLRRKF